MISFGKTSFARIHSAFWPAFLRFPLFFASGNFKSAANKSGGMVIAGSNLGYSFFSLRARAILDGGLLVASARVSVRHHRLRAGGSRALFLCLASGKAWRENLGDRKSTRLNSSH